MADAMNASFRAAGMTVFERGWLSSNNILFASGDSGNAVLVDSGYCTHAEQTAALVRQALAGRRLGRILNTHLHADHCGGNHALQVAFGCTIDVPAGDAAKVDVWDEAGLTYRATGQGCPRFERSGMLCAGQQIQCGPSPWQVVASPGHDPESVVSKARVALREPAWLVVGVELIIVIPSCARADWPIRRGPC